MAKRKVINEDIPSIKVPWDDGTQAYSGEAIERFIKSQLSSKVGYPIIPESKDADGYYHLWGFADKESYLEYLEDPETNAALRLSNIPIPLITEQEGVRNIVTLTRVSEGEIVTSQPVASVTVAYRWQQYNPINQGTTDQDEDATIIVSCRTLNANGLWGAWDSSKEFAVTIQSGQTKTIDLSRLLTSDATYQIRLTATGESSGATTSPITLSVIYSNVTANYDGTIATVYKGDIVQLPFRISGNVQKQLRIKINGYTKQFTLGTTTYTDNTYAAALTQAEFSLLRGAVKAEAWIAFGEGYTAETEHHEFQFIYIPEGDTTSTPVLAVTDIVEEFQNWTRTTIFRYAIFNPNQDETPLKLTLLDRDTGQIYIQKELVCVNGESYVFDENFSMECDGDEQPVVINAQAIFADADGATFGNTINFTVDNSENFAPTKGANIIVSAEKRLILIDGVEYQLENLLDNARDTNTGWLFNRETDSTGAEVNVPVLSIGAGNRLTLPCELFDENTGQNINGVEGSITIEFDIKSKNIVGDAVIIDASVPFSRAYTGFRFYPTRAVCLSRDNFTEDTSDAGFQEEVREHIAINIIRNLRGEGLNLVRIYVNGKANREFIYTDEDRFVPIGAKGAQSVIIGSDEADVDIYGIRIYKGQQLGSTQIQNDYMAGMPTIEDKKTFKRYNSIFNGTEIGYDLCNAMGLNTILRKIPEGGHYPSRENQSKQKNVEVAVRIYKERGNPDSLDTKHSGNFVGMTDKGQGTSAKGYYWWNITDGFEDDKEISAEEYNPNDPTHYTENDKYFKKVSYFNSLDGVSQVYASKYEIEDGRGGITKLVGKCNYASPMQSHKLGAIWAYDELWQSLVNNGSDGRPVLKNTHACCYEKPFLCFYQIGNGNPVFCGFQTWGSGKGDKKTFGYDKKKSPDYMCVSGADNGSIAALFQMPWVVNKNAQGAWEGNIYAHSVTINTGDIKNGYCYKSGNSDTLSFEVEIGSKYDGGETDKGVTRIEDEAKGGTENTLFTTFAEFANFVFACSPLLKPYAGTEAQLIADSENLVRDHQYWLFNSGADRFNIYYYNPATAKFEKAINIPTSWGDDKRAATFGSPKLTEQLAGITININTVDGKKNVTLEDAMDILGTSDMDVLNDCFIKARVSYFAAHAGAYIDISDCIFHQTFLKLEAGTDNRAKNTYYWIDPSIDKLVRLKQDDLDTIKATDNQGRQTKPYYALEHTKDENGSNFWNGENNVFYTLIERAFPDRMRNMMRDIFTLMAQICGSVEEYMQQRYYWVQEYFPAVAFNETNRLLYEVAQVKLMRGLIDVSQDPITQAIGDQLECEKQFMNQRLPMLMSWCEYETGGDGTLTFRSINNTQGQAPTYDIEYTAYQYIYPKLAIGGTMSSLYAKKNGKWVEQSGEPYLCAPGETVRLVAGTDSNTQLTIRWMHYAKSLGNLGSLPCGDEGTINITGRRLRKLECWSPDNTPIEFHPKGLTISNCRNLEEVNLTNSSAFSGTFSADLPRLRKLLLKGSAYTSVTLPKTSTLTEVELPATINALNIEGQPNLSSLLVEGMENLRTLRIVGEHQINKQTQSLVQLAFSQAKYLNLVQIENVAWTGFAVDAMMWLNKIDAKLTGSISLTGNLTFDYKLALAERYGDIDDSQNALFINYSKRAINSITINGVYYFSETGTYKYNLICTPSTGNDIALKDGKLAIEWSIEDSAKTYGSFTDLTSGLLKVAKLDESGTDMRYIIQCSITKTNGTTMTTNCQVGFYRRIPKVGDFAYADGTFDDQFLKNRTVVGVVYKLNEMWQGDNESEPTIFTGYNKPTEVFKSTRKLVGYQILIDCKENVSYRSFDNFINTSSVTWGLNASNDTNGHVGIQEEIKAATGIASIFNLSSIIDIPSIGLSGGAQKNYVLSTTYFDVEQDDGFKDYSTGSGCVTDWQGKQKTRTIIRHANQIINTYLLSDTNESVGIHCANKDGIELQLAEIPTTVEELANAMEVLHRANNNLTKYQQFLYPAAYGCYLYEPKVNEGETLDPQYAATNWYLPAVGELMRMYGFHSKSRTGGIGETYSVGSNTSPSRSVIDKMIQDALSSEESNEIKMNVSPSHVEYGNYTGVEMAAINRYFHTLIEADKPIYSMLQWRAMVANGSVPFTNHNLIPHWSSTEYSTYNSWTVNFGDGCIGNNYSKLYINIVRPAVAYLFLL